MKVLMIMLTVIISINRGMNNLAKKMMDKVNQFSKELAEIVVSEMK